MIALFKVDKNNIDEICVLSNTIWNECYKDLLSKEQIDYMLEKFLSYSAIEQNIKNNYNFFLIKYNNEYCGFFSYKVNNDHLYLSKLYIKSSYRGLKISNDIFKHLDQYKLDILLNVNKYNTALNYYFNKGFKIIKEEINDIGNNYVMDDYVMKKTFT